MRASNDHGGSGNSSSNKNVVREAAITAEVLDFNNTTIKSYGERRLKRDATSGEQVITTVDTKVEKE